VTAFDVQPLLARLCDRDAEVVFFLVRHHGPLCAALVEELIAAIKPASVLLMR
jgi:hypothetical protein